MKILNVNFKGLVFVLLVSFLAGCSGFNGRDEATISGVMPGRTGQKLILEKITPSLFVTIDSALVDADNEFAFRFHPEEKGFYLLRFEDEQHIILVFGPDEKLNIAFNEGAGMQDYDISGNEDSKILQQYFSETDRRQQAFDALREEFFNSTHLDEFPQIKERIDLELEQLTGDQRNFTIQTISKNPESITGLLLLNQRFANRLIIDINEDFDLFKQLDSTLMAKYPGNSHVLEHHRRVAEFRNQLEELRLIEEKLSPGRPIPDIALNDVSGKTHRLSDFRGQPALVYFWVSWSPPCRAANHQLKELYRIYQPKGLEIFAISLDHERRFWADAIKVDELPWINVSDLRGMSSPVTKVFNLPQELPFYYLIDGEGMIIIRSSKYSEIHKGVEELMKSKAE